MHFYFITSVFLFKLYCLSGKKHSFARFKPYCLFADTNQIKIKTDKLDKHLNKTQNIRQKD